MENSKKIQIWKFLSYFIIYSVIGFFIETIYAIFTKGMLESRKSFLYGPFCSIYGIAATTMIFALSSHNKIKVFILGSIIGLIVEYVFSYLGEIIFNARWWDYSNSFLNINGRICAFYAIIWGVLALLLVKYINPKIEKYFCFLIKRDNLKSKIFKILVIFLFVFIILNSILTSYAVKNFINEVSVLYNIKIKNFETKPLNENFLTKYFSAEKMIMIYPNISVITEKGEVLYLGSVLNKYKNYYYRFNK